MGGKASGPIRQLTGRSMADHIVVFDGTERLVGHTVRIAVETARPHAVWEGIDR